MSPSDICGDLFRLGSAGLGEINNLGAFHEYQSMLNAQYDYREVVCEHRPLSVMIITECLMLKTIKTSRSAACHRPYTKAAPIFGSHLMLQ